MTQPARLAALLMLLSGPVLAQSAPTPTAAALEQALQNFPPLIVGSNVQATLAGSDLQPKTCPDAGARVETKGGPTWEYLGASPGNPDLCLMRVGGQPVEAWYGIWATAWPGAEFAYRALQRVIRSRTGDVVGFDTVAAPGSAWHDLIRHEGIEEINLNGTVYKALKLAHYREGYDGNTYRSVSTVWKDLATGMLVYITYQHIAGRPALENVLIPTAIVPAS